MFFVSTLLGRCPQGLNIGASMTRLAVVAWLLTTFFIGNYLQSSVTASRSVPKYSAEIRTKEQLLKHLNEGTKDPCTGRFMHEVRGGHENEPVYKPVAAALRRCLLGCLDENGFGCWEKARRGTHIYFSGCSENERRVALQHGLVAGDISLASWQTYSAVHTRYPFRYMHRRLMMAVLESGIWMHYGTRFPLPPGNDDIVCFDMALHEYLVVPYAGLTLTLAAFLVETVVHHFIMKGEDKMARHRDDVAEMFKHRRLMMAVLESGIWMHYATRFPLPSGEEDTVSFDMALHEYMVVLYAGLTLALVAFLLEILVHNWIMKNEDQMGRRYDDVA
ncbi:hypothetical protein MTO96_005024 [Rhipicephalus appendiculatus]